jgi:hypothetical protein
MARTAGTIATALLTVLMFQTAPAQDRWDLYLSSGEVLSVCKLDSLNGHVLVGLRCNYQPFAIHCDSLNALRRYWERDPGTANLIGAGVGALAGLLIGVSTESSSGFRIATVVSFAFTGFILAPNISSQGVETYELVGKSLDEKLSVIRPFLTRR